MIPRPAATVGSRHKTAIVTLGGTIALRGHDYLDRTEYMYADRQLTTEELFASLPDFPGKQDLEVFAVDDVASHDLTTSHWCRLLRLVDGLNQRSDIDSVVITHGTNTLEETAFFLCLTLALNKPVVLTGSMRPPGAMGTDAESNLIDALRLVTDLESVALGVLVTIGGMVFAASDVAKANTRSLQGFRAVFGPLGTVEPDGQVRLERRPARPKSTIALPETVEELPRVPILLSHIAADGDLVTSAVDQGVQGLVSAGTGGGFPTASELRQLTKAAERGVWVCRASRAPEGLAAPPSVHAAEGKFLWGGRLSPWNARTALAVGLAAGVDQQTIQLIINEY